MSRPAQSKSVRFAPFDSQITSSPIRSRGTSGLTLETLPNEILTAIFSHLDGFVLPPLNRRLFPFHRSQLYKNVTLKSRQLDSFRTTYQSNEAIRLMVESLTFNFHLLFDRRSVLPRAPPSFLASFPNLRVIRQRLDPSSAQKTYPKVSDFEDNPKWEKLVVRSWVEYKETRTLGSDSKMFDWVHLRRRSEARIESEPDHEVLYSGDREDENAWVVVELRRIPGGTYGLRYFADRSRDSQIYKLLASTPLSHVQLVVFTHSVHLDRLLSSIGHPSLLTHLSLLSFNGNQTTIPKKVDFHLRFENLTHLALAGTALPTSPEFYTSIRQSSLKSLHIGPRTSLRIQLLINLFSIPSKPIVKSLKRLILDNINARAPTEAEEDTAHYNDWVFPKWTVDCPRAKVEELKKLMMRLGIAIGGTTFRGLEVFESEAYEAAQDRWLMEEPEPYESTTSGSETEDESENALL